MNDFPQCFQEYALEECVLPVGSAGKNAIAELCFERHGEKTYLSKNYNVTPAKVLHALYYDELNPGIPYVIFVNPTAGILEGDRYSYDISLGPNAEAFITDNTATKIYKMDSNYGSRTIDVQLNSGSRLEYMPKENIAFAKSRWHQDASFNLEKNASLFYSEIFCPGRVARGERWDFDVYSSRLTITKENKVVLMDNVRWTSGDKERSRMLFGNYDYLLSAYLVSKSVVDLKTMINTENVHAGVSEMPYSSGIIAKALSNNMDDLKEFQLHLWNIFREAETGSPAPNLRMQYGRF